jgi:hypothetical protein
VPEPRLSDTVRDAAEASLRYYGRMGGLALDLAEALVPSLSGLRPAVVRSTPSPAPTVAESPPGQTIVIEAAAGRSGLGVFMVENTTGKKVSGPLGVSAFADESGREVNPTVRFSPDVVSLEPGDQVLVQVVAGVDSTFEPGIRYGAEISIPELAAAGIPLVVRRRAARPPKA